MIIRRILSALPQWAQDEFRRARFLFRVNYTKFDPGEPEAGCLDRYVSSGDWVMDVGANVGQYTMLLSKIVGANGRVLAIEPISSTAATLAFVAKCAPWKNISILNVAASSQSGCISFHVPIDDDGLRNYERAAFCKGGDTSVLAITIDGLQLPNRLSLVKIDAEGHEAAVLAGMRQTLARDRPVLIVEDNDPSVHDLLTSQNYRCQRIKDDSPNLIWTPIA